MVVASLCPVEGAELPGAGLPGVILLNLTKAVLTLSRSGCIASSNKGYGGWSSITGIQARRSVFAYLPLPAGDIYNLCQIVVPALASRAHKLNRQGLTSRSRIHPGSFTILHGMTLIPSPFPPRRLLSGDLAIIFYFSFARLLLHLLVNAFGGYGFFRDEFYYLACAQHPAAGYVDHPPLSALLLSLHTAVFGDSLFSVRLIPALAAAFTVFFTGLMVRTMGRDRRAIFLACLFSFSPITTAMFSFYSMNSLDILFWTIMAYIFARIIRDGNKIHWLWLGIVVGAGALNKIGMLFPAVGLFVALLLSPHRKWLATPYPYAAALLAAVIASPFLIWNLGNDFAHLEFIRNASSGKYGSLSAIDFLSGQVLLNNPAALPVWGTGLFALFLYQPLRQFRPLVYLYCVPLLIFVFNGTSKAEYLAPAYSILWAAGAIFLSDLSRRSALLRAATTGIAVMVFLFALVLLPMVLPVLPVGTFVAYSSATGIKPPSTEGKELSELPQFYADMFGWEEKARAVEKVYKALPERDKTACYVFGNNYGRCASLEYYSKTYDLPPVIGNHNNYWIWGPRGYDGRVLIIMGGTLGEHKDVFEEVIHAGKATCTYCMPYENNVDIFVCRNLRGSINDIWPSEKHFE